MEFFVKQDSIVRRIWGNSDTILFVFAGASAEFALNKAVDWLYFTGKLPADPIGRLFSTVTYARQIVFAENEKALQSIDRITSIHTAVEKSRGSTIPDWAYRDVLYMLIHYSISSYELLNSTLTAEEKEEVYNVFYRVGNRMNLKDLPSNYNGWLIDYDIHLKRDLKFSPLTIDLFKQYKKHLGPLRYFLLKEVQLLVCPPRVIELLQQQHASVLKMAIPLYKASRKIKMDRFIKNTLLPKKYVQQVEELDVV